MTAKADPAVATWFRWHLLGEGPQPPAQLLAAYGKTAPAGIKWCDRDRRRRAAALTLSLMAHAGELCITGLESADAQVPIISLGSA